MQRINEDIKNGINIIIPMTIEDSTNEFFKLDLAYEMLNEEDTRIEKMEELSNNYNSFSSSEEREAIKFINIIDSVKNSSKEEKKEEIMLPNKDENNNKED